MAERSSIWDLPGAEDRNPTPPKGDGSVPVTHNEGIAPTPVIGPAGYGIVGGRPYGQQLVNEKRENDARFKFLPNWREALGGATRRALGR